MYKLTYTFVLILLIFLRFYTTLNKLLAVFFDRAMHYSAKRGLAIVRRPSVRLSVRDVGGPGPHRLEILKTNCTDN